MTATRRARPLLEAAALLALSAALLAAGLAAWGARGGVRTPFRVDGFALALSGADGERTLDGLRVEPLADGARASALRRGLELSAADWEHAVVEIAGDVVAPMLLWTTAGDPGRVFGTPLLRRGRFWRAQWLGSRAEWSGDVVALGVGLRGPLAESVEIRALRLEPVSPGAALAGVARDWTAFEGLDGHSQNFVIGGSSAERPLLRPVPAAAAWAGGALLLHLLLARRRGRAADPRVVACAAAVAWLALDARWQLDLLRQHARTRERYAGLTWSEKRAAAEDGALFRFCEQVKRLLPAEPQIVYVITREPEGAGRYLQLRARYHLFPHDVSSTYTHPPPMHELHVPSYLVVFAPRRDVVFDADASELVWDVTGRAVEPGAPTLRRLAATRLLDAPLGALYWTR